MLQARRPLPLAVTLGLPGLVLVGLVAIATVPAMAPLHRPAVWHGLAVDFVLSVPLLYLALVWRSAIPRVSVVPVFLVGVGLASLLVPDQHQSWLQFVRGWVVPGIELGVVALVAARLVALRRAYRHEAVGRRDVMETLRAASRSLLPSGISHLLATELAVIYYGVVARRLPPPAAHRFSYHRESGLIPLLIALLAVVALEATAIHFLLAMWSSRAAWLLTGLSLYGGLQLLALLRSIPRRPIEIESDRLRVRFGWLQEIDLPWDAIERVEATGVDPAIPFPAARKQYRRFGLTGHNVVIHLRQRVDGIGLYGRRLPCRWLALHVDKLDRFLEAVEAARDATSVSDPLRDA